MGLWNSNIPTIKPFYAVKCNPDKHLIKWLHEEEIGFDCASAREVSVVQEISKDANIIFANPCKKASDIVSSSAANVQITVVDSHEEIDKLCENSWTGSSLLRIRVDDRGSLMPFSAKFGIDPESIRDIATYARSKGQHITGISFHVGSACGSSQQYQRAIVQAAEGIITLRSKGHDADIIDIGGGFVREGFAETARVIRDAKDKISKCIRFIAEPGRFFAQTSHDLFVQVIGKKPMANGAPGYRYTIDDSLYGQFSCIPYDHARPQWIRVQTDRGEKKPRPKKPAVLFGRTCDSVDFIASAVRTEELMVGDWLWFPYMGAYTTVTSTEFNGFPKPPTTVLTAIMNEQLPEPKDFLAHDWPEGLQYVSAVKVPQ